MIYRSAHEDAKWIWEDLSPLVRKLFKLKLEKAIVDTIEKRVAEPLLAEELRTRQEFRLAYRNATDGKIKWDNVYNTWDNYKTALGAVPEDQLPEGHPIDDWSGIPGESLRTLPYKR